MIQFTYQLTNMKPPRMRSLGPQYLAFREMAKRALNFFYSLAKQQGDRGCLCWCLNTFRSCEGSSVGALVPSTQEHLSPIPSTWQGGCFSEAQVHTIPGTSSNINHWPTILLSQRPWHFLENKTLQNSKLSRKC